MEDLLHVVWTLGRVRRGQCPQSVHQENYAATLGTRAGRTPPDWTGVLMGRHKKASSFQNAAVAGIYCSWRSYCAYEEKQRGNKEKLLLYQGVRIKDACFLYIPMNCGFTIILNRQ